MYKLYIIGTDDAVSTYDYDHKPSFEDMYQLIDCSIIQISQAHLPKWSNRKDGYTDIYLNEEGGPMMIGKYDKEKNPKGAIVNKTITSAWYEWQKRTGHMSLPGDGIHGKVAVIQKTDAAERKTEPEKQ